jgi:queuosine biosynthesis protein QueC
MLPLFNFTKKEMEAEAISLGFIDLMEQTWFCHVPRQDGSPCGRCSPCRYTKEEGLGRRIKPLSLIFLLKDTIRTLISSLVKTVIKKTVTLPWHNR